MVFQASNALLDCVRLQLLAPRALSVRVGGAISSLLGVDDPLEGLSLERLSACEPFEVEWLLSSLFTPTHREREACETFLPPEGLASEVVDDLVAILSSDVLFCPISYGHQMQAVPVMGVLIERYVRLLHWDAAIPPLLRPVLADWVEGQDRVTLSSLARRPAWQSLHRAQMLYHALQAMVERDSFRIDKVQFLTDFVASYRPDGQQALLRALANLVEAYHQDSEHPIFNQQLEQYQGENLRSRYCDADVKAFRLAMAYALLTDLSDSPAMPTPDAV